MSKRSSKHKKKTASRDGPSTSQRKNASSDSDSDGSMPPSKIRKTSMSTRSSLSQSVSGSSNKDPSTRSARSSIRTVQSSSRRSSTSSLDSSSASAQKDQLTRRPRSSTRRFPQSSRRSSTSSQNLSPSPTTQNAQSARSHRSLTRHPQSSSHQSPTFSRDPYPVSSLNGSDNLSSQWEKVVRFCETQTPTESNLRKLSEDAQVHINIIKLCVSKKMEVPIKKIRDKNGPSKAKEVEERNKKLEALFANQQFWDDKEIANLAKTEGESKNMIKIVFRDLRKKAVEDFLEGRRDLPKQMKTVFLKEAKGEFETMNEEGKREWARGKNMNFKQVQAFFGIFGELKTSIGEIYRKMKQDESDRNQDDGDDNMSDGDEAGDYEVLERDPLDESLLVEPDFDVTADVNYQNQADNERNGLNDKDDIETFGNVEDQSVDDGFVPHKTSFENSSGCSGQNATAPKGIQSQNSKDEDKVEPVGEGQEPSFPLGFQIPVVPQCPETIPTNAPAKKVDQDVETVDRVKKRCNDLSPSAPLDFPSQEASEHYENLSGANDSHAEQINNGIVMVDSIERRAPVEDNIVSGSSPNPGRGVVGIRNNDIDSSLEPLAVSSPRIPEPGLGDGHNHVENVDDVDDVDEDISSPSFSPIHVEAPEPQIPIAVPGLNDVYVNHIADVGNDVEMAEIVEDQDEIDDDDFHQDIEMVDKVEKRCVSDDISPKPLALSNLPFQTASEHHESLSFSGASDSHAEQVNNDIVTSNNFERSAPVEDSIAIGSGPNQRHGVNQNNDNDASLELLAVSSPQIPLAALGDGRNRFEDVDEDIFNPDVPQVDVEAPQIPIAVPGLYDVNVVHIANVDNDAEMVEIVPDPDEIDDDDFRPNPLHGDGVNKTNDNDDAAPEPEPSPQMESICKQRRIDLYLGLDNLMEKMNASAINPFIDSEDKVVVVVGGPDIHFYTIKNEQDGIKDCSEFKNVKIRKEYQEDLQAVAWCSDKSACQDHRVVCGGKYGVVHVINPVTGTVERELYAASGINDIRVHPENSKIMAVACTKSIRVFHSETEQSVVVNHHECGPYGAALSIDWTTDGRWLISGGEDGSIEMWDFKDKELQACLNSNMKLMEGKKNKIFQYPDPETNKFQIHFWKSSLNFDGMCSPITCIRCTIIKTCNILVIQGRGIRLFNVGTSDEMERNINGKIHLIKSKWIMEVDRQKNDDVRQTSLNFKSKFAINHNENTVQVGLVDGDLMSFDLTNFDAQTPNRIVKTNEERLGIRHVAISKDGKVAVMAGDGFLCCHHE